LTLSVARIRRTTSQCRLGEKEDDEEQQQQGAEGTHAAEIAGQDHVGKSWGEMSADSTSSAGRIDPTTPLMSPSRCRFRVRALVGAVVVAALSAGCGNSGTTTSAAAVPSSSTSSSSSTTTTSTTISSVVPSTTSTVVTSTTAAKSPATTRPAAPTTTTTRRAAPASSCAPSRFRVDATGLWSTPAGGKATLLWRAPAGRDRAIRSVAWSPNGARVAFTYVADDGTRIFATVNRDGTGFTPHPLGPVTALTWNLVNRPVVVTARPPAGTDPHHYDVIQDYGDTAEHVALLSASAGEVAGIDVRPGSGEIVYLNEYGVHLLDLAKGIFVPFKIGSGGPADVSRRKLSVSPDGAWAAVIVDGTRMLVDLTGGSTVALGPAGPDDMVGPWSADGSAVGYLGHPDGGDGSVTAYRRDGSIAWTRPAVAGDPGFSTTGWAGTVLCR
jgi:hypothetical protein